MTRVFINKYPDRYCAVCAELIPMGEQFTWSRSGNEKAKLYHLTCNPNGNGTSASETESAGNLANDDTSYMDDAGAGVATVATTTTNGNASAGADWLTGLAGAIAPYLESRLNAKLDREQVEQIVKRLLGNAIIPHVTTVRIEDVKTGETRDLGIQHKLFPTLMKLVKARSANGRRMNIWLTGPAGSGKTTAVEKVSKALELRFYHVGAMDNEYKLMGFIDAQGKVVNTLFREWWINGGVICLDEVDSWLPAATLALNGALANGHCTFPDGMFSRHPNAVVVACANTWGLGGTNDYVGRMKQDAAFLDRFIKLDWQYDEQLETVICGNPTWAKRVQTLRAKAKAKGLKVIISPRASENGAGLLADGLEQDLVEEVTMRQGMTAEQWESIQ